MKKKRKKNFLSKKKKSLKKKKNKPYIVTHWHASLNIYILTEQTFQLENHFKKIYFKKMSNRKKAHHIEYDGWL